MPQKKKDFLPVRIFRLCQFGEGETESDERTGLHVPLAGAPYHATRRHTVGPGDSSHQPPSPYPYPCAYSPGYPNNLGFPTMQCNVDPQMLPHTNLPLNLPLVQHQPPQNFQIKDQHLLKPPTVMGAS